MTRLLLVKQGERRIADGVGQIDPGENAEALREWEHDAEAMEPEVVFASMVAGLA